MISVHLVARDNGAGLSRDLEILRHTIGNAGFELAVSAIGQGGLMRQIGFVRVRATLALRGLRVFIVKAGTGGALFRSLHAEFLHDSAALLGEPALDEAGALYDELAATYAALAAIAEHAEGVELVARAAALERDGVAAAERWLATRSG